MAAGTVTGPLPVPAGLPGVPHHLPDREARGPFTDGNGGRAEDLVKAPGAGQIGFQPGLDCNGSLPTMSIFSKSPTA